MKNNNQVIALLSSFLLMACVNQTVPDGVSAVTPFDVNRYAGKWYEIARLDHRFEKGMSYVTADYSLSPDGSIKVVNRGYL